MSEQRRELVKLKNLPECSLQCTRMIKIKEPIKLHKDRVSPTYLHQDFQERD